MAAVLDSASIDANDVREIYDTDLTDGRLANFINMAVVTVARLTTLTDADTIKLLELMLSAHFAAVYDGTVKQQSIGGGEWSVTFAMAVGTGLDASPYGQQAQILDPTGKLAKIQKPRAKFQVTSEYDTYESTYLQGLTDDA